MTATEATSTAAAAPPSSLRRWLPEIALISVVLIWSSTWIAMKDALEVIDPLAFMAGRFTLITALAWAVALVQHTRTGISLRVGRADWRLLVAGALTGYTIYQLCAIIGLNHSSVFTLSLLIALMPLFTMLIQVARREPIPRFGPPGILVAVAGTALFLSGGDGGGEDTLLGVVLSLGAALAFAVYGLVSRPLTLRYPSATLSAWGVLIGTVPMVLIGWTSVVGQDWSGLPVRVWAGIVFVVIFPVYVAYQLWNYGIRHIGASRASSYALIVPILSGIQSSIAFGEELTVVRVGSALLVIAGLMVVRLERLPWQRGQQQVG